MALLTALAVGLGGATSAWAQKSPDETAPSDHFTAAPQSGVIKPPPAHDPGIRKAPPATAGTMPVIPPPGTPGSSSQVVPK